MRRGGTDHLGSVEVSGTNSWDHNAGDRTRYCAYGTIREGAGSGSDRRYTGQTWDTVGNLYWLGSRFYDPALGRFIQPDAIVPVAEDPLAWDRHAYCLSTPVRYAPPTGMLVTSATHNSLAQRRVIARGRL